MLDANLRDGEAILRSLEQPVRGDLFVTTAKDAPIDLGQPEKALETYLDWAGSISNPIKRTMIPDTPSTRDFIVGALAYIIAKLHAVMQAEIHWSMHTAQNAVVIFVDAAACNVELDDLPALNGREYNHIRVGIEEVRQGQKRILILMTSEAARKQVDEYFGVK